jgi:hypothetical protein
VYCTDTSAILAASVAVSMTGCPEAGRDGPAGNRAVSRPVLACGDRRASLSTAAEKSSSARGGGTPRAL